MSKSDQPAGVAVDRVVRPKPAAYIVTIPVDVGVGMDHDTVLRWELGLPDEASEPLYDMAGVRALVALELERVASEAPVNGNNLAHARVLIAAARFRVANDKAEESAAAVADLAIAAASVDRTKTTLTDGSPVTTDHRELRADGQQKGYVVLSADERTNGYVRPVRRSYVHDKCGGVTTMGQSIAETYARDPSFYGGTFCAVCRAHFPVGAAGQFTWDGTTDKVGT